jgi:hypothetical protein
MGSQTYSPGGLSIQSIDAGGVNKPALPATLREIYVKETWYAALINTFL